MPASKDVARPASHATRSGLARPTSYAVTAMLAILLLASGFGACQAAYYSTMEKFGVHKREILVDRVKDAREDQKRAKELFVSTYDQFKALTKYDGGELEKRYKRLDADYEDCASKAADVKKRIASVEDVAGALFKEWQGEIEEIHSPDIKRRSSESLAATKKRYADLVGTMKHAAGGMDPVLTAFHDHVLGLKHDLNAHAVASLQGTVSAIQDDVSTLIEDMQRSIREADAFIESMNKS